MKIVVLVKEVPDTYGERALNLETGLADREASAAVLDEIGERAIEVALRYADQAEATNVTVLTMAPGSASTSIRKALALGATEAVHVADEALLGADLGLTAEVLVAALKECGFDLVVCGNQSTDGMSGMLPAMLAELLEVPFLGPLDRVEIEADRVSGTRVGDGTVAELTAGLPALVTVTEQLPEARFPNFKGIMAAKKKPVRVCSLAELGVDATDMSVSRSIMTAIAERPPRAAGVKLVDDGGAAARLAEALSAQRLL